MKKIILAATALTLILIACSKADDPSTLTVAQWTLNGTTYKMNKVAPSTAAIVAEGKSDDNKTSSITVHFYNNFAPTTTKNYKIVTEPSAADEISLTASSQIIGDSTSMKYYYSQEPTSGVASFVVNGNIITMTVPEISLAPGNGTTPASFSGTVIYP